MQSIEESRRLLHDACTALVEDRPKPLPVLCLHCGSDNLIIKEDMTICRGCGWREASHGDL